MPIMTLQWKEEKNNGSHADFKTTFMFTRSELCAKTALTLIKMAYGHSISKLYNYSYVAVLLESKSEISLLLHLKSWIMQKHPQLTMAATMIRNYNENKKCWKIFGNLSA